jgi:ATP-binding cassette, subfamily B, bacterial PglK
MKEKKVSKNFIFQSFFYLNKIFDKYQKKTVIILLIIMIFGMFFEILLLNNLMILLNYLTEANVNPPPITVLFNSLLKIDNPKVLVLFIFIVTFFLKTITNIIVRWKDSKFIYELKAQISELLYIGYIKLPFIFHQRTNSSKILKNITYEIEQFSMFISSMTKIVLESLVMIGISIYLFKVNYQVSLVCIFAFLVFGYCFNFFNKKKIKTMSVNRLFHEDEKMKSVIEGLSGMREYKFSSKEQSVIDNFILHNNSIAKISTSMALRGVMTKPAFEIFMLILLSIFLFYFISYDLLNASIIPILGIYMAAAYRLIPSIALIVQSGQEIQFSLAAVKNLYKDIKKFKQDNAENFNSKTEIKFNKKIEIKNLTFSYDPQDIKNKKNILENLNLEIKKGDFIGIYGESGSGKSTLIDILIGLHTPNTGEILVDERNTQSNVKNWQNLIGCVPQEVFILDDTLKKNIAFGLSEEKISNKDVERALKFSNLLKFSTSLENGINTIIGEKGSRLSGGQKQRIGIARAIYNNPEILIFDESTNSLDVETENNIIEEINLLKKNKTLIIVSHNKEIFKKCDYVFKISEKKIKKISNIN